MTLPAISMNAQSRAELRDGHSIPYLGLGVWETPPEQTAEVVREAIKIGYRSVDTARLYKNEDGVGQALAGHPDIFVTTKLWNDEQGYDSAIRAFEESARRLGRSVVDLYLIHWPMPQQGLYVETWRALVRLKQEGRVRSIGVSNFMPEHLERIMDATGEAPVLNQVELHPYFQQKELRAFHERHNIRTESWRPLGKGALLEDAVVSDIAKRHGRSPAQILIRWHLQNNLIVIPKTVSPKRLAENFDVFDFSLDETDMQEIATLDRPNGRMGMDPMKAVF